MSAVKAVVFDYIGTLTSARDYNLEVSRSKLYEAICEAGFETNEVDFHKAYTKAHEKYRIVRCEKLIEVTNAVWVCEALNNLGFETTSNDPRLKVALNVFFKDYIDSLELRPYAKKLLKKISECCKLGLISNFTYAPVIHSSLRKLGISKFFNIILTSDEVGWRKPHKRIFQEVLNRLQSTAEETLFIGDSPMEDIKGAQAAGMKTIFVTSQFYSLADLTTSNQNPNITVKDLREICNRLPELLQID